MFIKKKQMRVLVEYVAVVCVDQKNGRVVVHIAVVDMQKEEHRRGDEAQNAYDDVGPCHEVALAAEPRSVGQDKVLPSINLLNRVILKNSDQKWLSLSKLQKR
jgi:hypothetical protein